MHSQPVRLWVSAVAAALVTCAAPAVAQRLIEGTDTIQGTLSNVRLVDPELESPVRSAVPTVVISALRGDGEARAQAGFALGQLSAIFAASAPFTGKTSDPDTELATDAGLTGGTTLSLTVSGLVWGPSEIGTVQQTARTEWCRAQQRAERFSTEEINCLNIAEGDLEVLRLRRPALTQAAVDALRPGFTAATNKTTWCNDRMMEDQIPMGFNCDNVTLESLQSLTKAREARNADSVQALVRSYRRAARLGWDIPIQYGLQGKISPQSFDFLDAATLGEGSKSHLAYSIGGGVGVFVRPFIRLDADVSYERTFKAGRSTQVCTPLPPPGTSQCGDAVLGGPTQTDGWVAEAGVRHFLRVGGMDVALNPRVRYRNEDETYTARVPIYFLPDKSGTSLLGGVAPTWNSGTERFGIVLFVGSTFNLDAPIR